MAARRAGFSAFFEPLYKLDKLKTGLLNGTLPGISLFANQVLPLIIAYKANDSFALSRIARKYSAFLNKDTLKASSNPIKEIQQLKNAIDSLCALWKSSTPTLKDVLVEVYRSRVFQISDSLLPIVKRISKSDNSSKEEPGNSDKPDEVIEAWEEALQCSFCEFEEYVKYISDESRFGTHQGIKGLEFQRVMVILDDEEARGFMFSYEKNKNNLKNKLPTIPLQTFS